MQSKGYVYILEVKDIVLPVCKIGMTTRSPYKRCEEINNSSTGDFIWSVAYYFPVNDCKTFESLIHQKLAPLRQVRREFFNLSADDANIAVKSIIDKQELIHMIDPTEIELVEDEKLTRKKKKHQPQFNSVDSQYTEVLQEFNAQLSVKGKPFGQLNTPLFGISDGNQGVQWNLAVDTSNGLVRLGVNLEGSQNTGKWLISPFILNLPDIEILKSSVSSPELITLRFMRDAWQGPSRLNIIEKFFGGREYLLSEMSQRHWHQILQEALSCLDETRNFCSRKKSQSVTLVSDGRKLSKDVSPHLTVWTAISLEGDISANIKKGFKTLQPVYDWVVASCS
ncbi:GIY-YIG nuclease family protein [Photobacterium ganghwense]|uniref:GIY-YIG nuclease family protein n=1 Tax=Photobacterium ganghwense TaxID=320778 RepID=UPI0040576933